ncbi:DUF3516 domain-containing protein, partial [Pseudokineococcus marinus]
PEGFVAWTRATFDKLVAADPEPLRPHFAVSTSMVLNVLARPGTPSRAPSSCPTASGRGGTGSVAKRAGSRDGSTPKASRGTSVHPSTSSAPPARTTARATSTGAPASAARPTSAAARSPRP